MIMLWPRFTRGCTLQVTHPASPLGETGIGSWICILYCFGDSDQFANTAELKESFNNHRVICPHPSVVFRNKLASLHMPLSLLWSSSPPSLRAAPFQEFKTGEEKPRARKSFSSMAVSSWAACVCMSRGGCMHAHKCV